ANVLSKSPSVLASTGKSWLTTLATATEHAKAAVSRLKERAKNGHHCIPIRHDIEPSLNKP
ncbi:MAG: hypothetical protein WA445_27080, partial [Pseudolabrys sp.]